VIAGVAVVLLLGMLATRALLAAHHGPPVHAWERRMNLAIAVLVVVVTVLFVLQLRALTGL
jgi:hypothetical protein